MPFATKEQKKAYDARRYLEVLKPKTELLQIQKQLRQPTPIQTHDPIADLLNKGNTSREELEGEPVELKGYREAFNKRPINDFIINPPNGRRFGDDPQSQLHGLAQNGGERHSDGTFGWISMCPKHYCNFVNGVCPICESESGY